jgi:glycogen(starch) synthase
MDHSVPRTSGYTIRARYLLEAQAAAGHSVTVVTSPSQGPDAIDQEVGGVRFLRTAYSPFERSLVRVGVKPAVFGRAIERGLVRLLRREQFDLVHGHTPFTVAGPASRQARARRLPFVYEKRNLWEESARARGKLAGRWPFRWASRRLDRAVTRQAGAVCTITRALKSHTVAMGVAEERVFVVGNGVDVDRFAPRPRLPGVRERCARGGSFVVGFIGSFFSFEGLPLLVRAFASAWRVHPEARLVLVGDGEDAPALERLITELGLGSVAWLAGKVPHEAVLDFYAAMDVLVYPRYRSPLTEMISPLKPLEPMAMQRCVIGSDVGGLRELIRDGENGLLFVAGSEGDLERTLDRALKGEIDLAALGARARRWVVAERQWKHMAAIYDDAYRYVQAGQGRPS